MKIFSQKIKFAYFQQEVKNSDPKYSSMKSTFPRSKTFVITTSPHFSVDKQEPDNINEN